MMDELSDIKINIMDAAPKPKCKGGACCKCAPVRKIMNMCIQNNGPEKCETFKQSYQECLQHYRALEKPLPLI